MSKNGKVKKERTGWRDFEISKRHRKWGADCPSVDLDFVMLEFNYAKPVAIVEYKHNKTKESPPFCAKRYKALKNLANGYEDHQLPFFIAVYWKNPWRFQVHPKNDAAESHYKHVAKEIISEKRFAKSLHLLRKEELEDDDKQAIADLDDVICSG